MSKPIEIMHYLYGASLGSKTCAECTNLECHRYDRNYYKCKVYGISRSTATDWRKSWTACGMLNKTVQNQRPVKDWWRSYTRKEIPNVQIEGQIEFEVTL